VQHLGRVSLQEAKTSGRMADGIEGLVNNFGPESECNCLDELVLTAALQFLVLGIVWQILQFGPPF
jgi:hypothetical protein